MKTLLGSFFFAQAGKEIFFCRATAETGKGILARCLNGSFEAIVDDDGWLLLPRSGGRRARVELIVSGEPKFDPRDHAQAIAYFLQRKSLPV